MIEATEFRKALGRFATGIAIVTTMDDRDAPVGLTVNSFNSVSLDPPLVLWSLDKSSNQMDAFCSSGFYGVSILAHDQQLASNLFAAMAEDRFEKVEWSAGQTGAPLIDGALARIDCKTEQIIEGGDHVILLGRVVDIAVSEGDPLVYYGGGYRALA
ncbi:NADH-FMN oxidoreductase RutF, flavin reductase (DIM6/NTAB) family [Cohaesibacter marisflavi]|uniref:NADH-FMN oxidoreductase RutF, flavin reductase (DIM6/NTAB) family n=1 Tax=Cohaesibacter marisflavi TaxID=655353 RepID=A0A1I5FYQ2_9HYPH|nr:flavin reductase family protein [Cohaesibacter marisflavi]SFO28895.1 NADH-FMN oxidoreductase RutF, flavin reductase (DIM6/NTAB) family [Cohaesibacter marisflavi]